MTPATRFKKLKEKAKRLVKGGRSNRRLYGGVFELSEGKQIYIAFRTRKEIYRSGEKSVSAARDKGIACWAIDYDTLLEMRREQIFLIGVYVRDEEEFYITRYENFFDDTKANVHNFEARGGSLQKYLPLQHFMRLGKSAIS